MGPPAPLLAQVFALKTLFRPALYTAQRHLGSRWFRTMQPARLAANIAPGSLGVRAVAASVLACVSCLGHRQFHSSYQRNQSKRDYYEMLGLKKDASQADIKKAYYQLAKQYHPDKNKGDKEAEKKFAEISEAYEVLGSEESRKRYDQEGQMGAEFKNFRGQHPNFDPRDLFRNFESVFGGNMFGGGAAGGFNGGMGGMGYSEGTKTMPLTLSFMEAAKGCVKRLRFRRLGPCQPCNGSGAKPGTSPVQCPSCGGSGRTRMNTMFGDMVGMCNKCNGSGRAITKPCNSCSGTGRKPEETHVDVTIPAGIESNTNLLLNGKGDVGPPGTPPGDVILQIQVQPSSEFEREGADITSRQVVDMVDAALGTESRAKLVDGEVVLKIPAGTQPGDRLRLRGKGLKKPNGDKGDHFVEVVVRIPRSLNRKQRELLEEFKKIRKDS
eukprot:comp22396_c0_seq1/m.33425 comp22396_c0_seq1/g.33425  ORF comp22396_c0_seq1/g.33425 comp22396_c0_seq1/m.33425 type:complete len:439 (-) comp22396_c0_seq1:61-1377(-)